MNVYKHYNQEQLDYQYNTRLQVPDYADVFRSLGKTKQANSRTEYHCERPLSEPIRKNSWIFFLQ